MKNNKRNITFLGGLAVAVLLPLSFYVITRVAAANRVAMPGHYAIVRVDTTNENGKVHLDTIYRQVPDIELTNQLGKKISLNGSLKGKILVLNFFSINGPDSCDKLTANMRGMEKAFAKDPKKENSLDTAVQFISISMDPQRDSFPALRVYADRHKANHDHWWLLTGDRNIIYNYVRNELNVDLPMTADSVGHTNQWVLLDKNRYIRGYYNGLDTAGLKLCADDVVLLSLENDHKHKK